MEPQLRCLEGHIYFHTTSFLVLGHRKKGFTMEPTEDEIIPGSF